MDYLDSFLDQISVIQVIQIIRRFLTDIEILENLDIFCKLCSNLISEKNTYARVMSRSTEKYEVIGSKSICIWSV